MSTCLDYSEFERRYRECIETTNARRRRELSRELDDLLLEGYESALRELGSRFRGSGSDHELGPGEAQISHSILRGAALRGNALLASKLGDKGLGYYYDPYSHSGRPLLVTYGTPAYRRIFETRRGNKARIGMIWIERDSPALLGVTLGALQAQMNGVPVEIIAAQPTEGSSFEQRQSQQQVIWYNMIESMQFDHVATVIHDFQKAIPLIDYGNALGVRTILLFHDKQPEESHALTCIGVDEYRTFLQAGAYAIRMLKRGGRFIVLSGEGVHGSTRVQPVLELVELHNQLKNRIKMEVYNADFNYIPAVRITRKEVLDSLDPHGNVILAVNQASADGAEDVIAKHATELHGARPKIIGFDASDSTLKNIKASHNLSSADAGLAKIGTQMGLSAAKANNRQPVDHSIRIESQVITSQNVDAYLERRLRAYSPLDGPIFSLFEKLTS